MLAMSFMYRMNIKGPSTVPCGTPDLTAVSSDDSPSTTTHCVRPVSQFLFSLICALNKRLSKQW